MSQVSDREGPPTYYANVVTSNLNVDELVLEFRRVTISHEEQMKGTSGKVIPIPPVTQERVMQEEPLVRVVVTFTAVKGLKQYLDEAFPLIERARQTGETL